MGTLIPLVPLELQLVSQFDHSDKEKRRTYYVFEGDKITTFALIVNNALLTKTIIRNFYTSIA